MESAVPSARVQCAVGPSASLLLREQQEAVE